MLARCLLTCCFAFVALLAGAADSDSRQILMIAGGPSHGYGAHEHYAGLKLLQQSIHASTDSAQVTVVRGWPEDASLIEAADSIVIYADGGGRHPALPHRDLLRRKLADGCGFVCLHYAVEVPKGEAGDDWLDFLGGYFETHWSVNPHWVAEFKSLPEHPIARGVEPFSANDEWYFHMRFHPTEQVTPILQAVAPESTMRRKDGAHSGNPAVRKSVAAGEPQTVAWAYERPDGGRSFGFTGGHYHWNWAHVPIRRLVTNAIRWTAGETIEPGGSSLGEVGMKTLLENQDYEPPKNFSEQQTAEQFDVPKDGSQGSAEEPKDEKKKEAVKASEGDSAKTKRESPSSANSGSGDRRAAGNAISGLDVAEGLEVTLVASEPELRSLTNLDIDDRGRIWVCDVMNYRGNAGSRPEGDRILILEDTTGDGVADSTKTFYRGRDIDSAMGICVLGTENGNEVIVSAAPYVWRLIDEDGDDKADRKEAMFTETGQPQHDHSAHSFLFGPDGKLYWNVGNTGRQVKNAQGETVIDIHGRPVVDNGSPFYGGMPFRCDLDGSNFEVLAHNFRNNWETTVDSFGTLWQSDNDDDGNRGTRINFVMEQGNYGYRDELTGAGWRDERITMDEEVPRRHWHLNDPGVVPNLLQTGAGSPSGICLYEGRLLPQRFWDEMIHCDPGPNVVRAYPTEADGAGYRASIEPVLTGTEDKWFRPADVCVAPDGSIFITDWYDPGVGGHRQEDLQRGRLFRVAPPGTPYEVPSFDYSTAAGAADALRNPNLVVRYKAWMALHEMGSAAEDELRQLYRDPNPRLRARALWLLGKIDGRGEHYVERALADANPNIRITGIRLAKQIGLVPSLACVSAAEDPSPAVRRELAIALRFDDSASMPGVWAKLAAAYPAGDRWYLEALGIGSDRRASACYDAWIEEIGGQWDTPAGRDIVWRVRAPAAAEAMVQLIENPQLPLVETDRYFRSLEYHKPAVRDEALKTLLPIRPKTAGDSHSARRDAVIVRAVERMEDEQYANHQRVQAAIARHITRHEGTAEFLRLVGRFRPEQAEPALQRMLLGSDDDSVAVEAARLLAMSREGRGWIRQLLRDGDPSQTQRVVEVLGLLGNKHFINMLVEVAREPDREYSLRSAAVRGLAASHLGANRMLQLASAGTLPADTALLAGGLLHRSSNTGIRERAAKLLPQPKQADHQPLEPLDVLATMRGDAENGLKLFRGKATCSKCHVVDGEGKEVGPDLSEIGSKLSREAMFTSILTPSAGISHNYENYVALTDAGQVIAGVKISETDEQLVLRTAEAIDRAIPKAEIVEVKKSAQSMMPADLHQTVDQQGLVDVVEYLMTLKKPGA